MYVCIYVYAGMHVCTHVSMYVNIHIYIHIYTHIHTDEHVCVCQHRLIQCADVFVVSGPRSFDVAIKGGVGYFIVGSRHGICTARVASVAPEKGALLSDSIVGAALPDTC